PLPASLSDDIFRYIWDGRVAGAGSNPYLLAPEDAELEPLRDDLYERLPHRAVETVYPPLALAVFTMVARFPAPVLLLKSVLLLADLGVCWLLLLIARRLSLPSGRTIWYAWSPLAVLEISGMGHVDALGILAVSAVVLALVSRPRWVLSAAVGAAAAVLAKVVPVVAVPLWARSSGRPMILWVVAVALVALSFAPVILSVGGVPPGYVAYGVSWEFNGPLFEPLWRLLDHLALSERIEGTLDHLKETRGEHEFWNRFYPFNYPQFIAKLMLGAVAAGAIGALSWFGRSDRPAELTGMIFGVLIVCSATVYPWYLLWVLPWAALARQPAWLLLAALIPISYLPQFTEMSLLPWGYLVIWLPFALTLAFFTRWSTD
ncbi:MAG: hypothetical protein OES47_04760, partial [Acidobacteriota bacterium]|nr:hypothetical protein [Acidobacteriota bacterium]